VTTPSAHSDPAASVALDALLVERARAGDLPALAQLLERHRPQLRRLCRQLLVDPDLSDDIVQEAMIVAILDLDRLREPHRFGAWLAGIARNLSRRQHRRAARAAWSWEAAIGGSLAGEPIDTAPGPEESTVRAEAARSVRRAIAALPDGQRHAVRLHYLDELSYREVADKLGIDVGAVKARLHRARTTLRPALTPIARKDPTMTTAPETLEMRITDVRRDAEHDRHVVILASAGGRHLPIWIGSFEATALAVGLQQADTPRPFTFPLMASLVDALGGRVREVLISDLVDGTFYAEILLDHPGEGQPRIDARPSDALNLALVVGAPVQATTAVLEAVESSRWSLPDDLDTALPDGAADIVAEVRATWERQQHHVSREDPEQ
jgi:uncharacterized protein